MPSNSRVFLKPFIGGLNTEGSDVDDMVLNTSDELNCTILPEQMRGRRYGFNIEKDGQWINTTEESIVAHSLYQWNNVYDNVNYIVVQINKHLYIYPDIKPHSQQTYLADIDLSDYETLNVIEPVSMTSVTSSLFVVGRWITPIVIEADQSSGTFTVVVNNPRFRDFNGVEDGYAVDYLPTASEGLTARHKYNLINQGWDKTIYNPTDGTSKTLLPDGLGYEGLFFNDYADKYGIGCYPANNMQWFLGKQNSGEYNTTDLLNTYFGNTWAPKGHFIIDYLHRDRSLVSGIDLDDVPAEPGKNYDRLIPVNNSEGFAAWELACRLYFGFDPHPEAYISIPNDYKISFALPTNVSGVLTEFSWGLKDGVIPVGTGGAVSPNPDNIVKNAYRNDPLISDLYIFSQPFTMSLIGITGTGAEVTIASEVIQLTGKMFTAAGWDYTVTNTTSYRRYEIRITWPNLDRSHKWIVPDTLSETVVINEINYDPQEQENFEGLPSSDLLRGAITDVESFGGRLFYLCGNTVLFSQTLSTNNKNFDKCYQEADPTSEEISDIVATDGGMIQLLSLGRGKALKSFYRGVLVFGDEEVTGVLSNSINLFTAESYDVVKITTAGLTSKYSVVETDQNVFYWSNHGIFMIGIDENNNISSVCISLNTIQNWYNNLSQTARDHCVGYYDYANNRIYWFYPTTNVTDKLDGCLVYDLTYNCFMPQYIDSGNVIRDLNGRFAGILSDYRNSYKVNGKTFECSCADNAVFDTAGEVIGYTQNTYLTDCQESSSVYEIEPTVYLRASGNRVIAGENKVLASSTKDVGYNRKSAGIFLISDGTKYSFGDFNDREFRDWDVSPYESYLVSRPITLGDTYWNKQTPVMQTLFKRTEEYKLKKFDNKKEVFIYNIKNIYDKQSTVQGSNYRYNKTWLYNAGSVEKVSVTVDLSKYADSDTIHYISVAVSGYDKNSNNGTVVTNYSIYPDAPGGTFYTYDIPLDAGYDGKVCDYFKIDINVGGGALTMDKAVSSTSTITLKRSNLSEPLFKGFKNVEYSGIASLEIGKYPTRYEAYISTEEGHLLDGEITIAPAIWQFFSPTPPPTWTTHSASFVANKGYATGIDGTPTNDNPTFSGQSTTEEKYNKFGIFVDGFNLTGQGTLKMMLAKYVFTLAVPEFIIYNLSSEYTTPSGTYIRMRWGWSVNPLSNRWDMVQNGYRPQKDFLHDDYVESRLHIHGRGKAFQVEIRNDDNKDFRLTGLNIITRSPQ